ncbi:MAG: PmeII family type II restriction endonuclease [Thermoguttaceae bacterium]
MKSLKIGDVVKYVEDNIGDFHKRRVECLQKMELKKKLLRKKNPYMFKAKNILTASEIVQSLADAFISSNEETVFGNWIEGLAIFINEKVYKGWKSGIGGIDLEFDNDGVRYIVNIKSGPNWGNSSQIAKMRADFVKAKKTLRTSQSRLNIEAINGCCYGKGKNYDKGDYQKLCGQRFWEFISGNERLYIDIIEPLGHQAKLHNDEFKMAYSNMLNKMTLEFSQEFCMKDGSINWAKIVEYNSGISNN